MTTNNSTNHTLLGWVNINRNRWGTTLRNGWIIIRAGFNKSNSLNNQTVNF